MASSLAMPYSHAAQTETLEMAIWYRFHQVLERGRNKIGEGIGGRSQSPLRSTDRLSVALRVVATPGQEHLRFSSWRDTPQLWEGGPRLFLETAMVSP